MDLQKDGEPVVCYLVGDSCVVSGEVEKKDLAGQIEEFRFTLKAAVEVPLHISLAQLAHPNLAALHPYSRPHDGPSCNRVPGLKLALGGQNMLNHSRSPGERFPLCLPLTYKD
jgi:hypothetical protein